MQTVFDAILTHAAQKDGSDSRPLFSTLEKAYERLQKLHAASEWAEFALPPLWVYRQKLQQFSSHSEELLTRSDEEAAFTISERAVH